MGKIRRGVTKGPMDYWEDLQLPPYGYEWIYLSFIVTDDRVRSGWPPLGTGLFLRPVPIKTTYEDPYLDFRRIEEMKRYGVDTQKKTGKWQPHGDPLLKPYPTINQLCSDYVWEDGTPREPCTLKFGFGPDGARVTITDGELKASITTFAETSTDALTLLDEALAANKVSWRPWPNQGKKKKD